VITGYECKGGHGRIVDRNVMGNVRPVDFIYCTRYNLQSTHLCQCDT
jgi:hypothetical protein